MLTECSTGESHLGRKTSFSVRFSNISSLGLSLRIWRFSGLEGQHKCALLSSDHPSSHASQISALLSRINCCFPPERGFVAECPAEAVLLGTTGPKNQRAKVMGGANLQAGLLQLCHSDRDTQMPLGLAKEQLALLQAHCKMRRKYKVEEIHSIGS